jgi:hypothetical protein
MRPLVIANAAPVSPSRINDDIHTLTKQVSNLEKKRIGLTNAINFRKNALNRLKAQLALCEPGSTLA